MKGKQFKSLTLPHARERARVRIFPASLARPSARHRRPSGRLPDGSPGEFHYAPRSGPGRKRPATPAPPWYARRARVLARVRTYGARSAATLSDLKHGHPSLLLYPRTRGTFKFANLRASRKTNNSLRTRAVPSTWVPSYVREWWRVCVYTSFAPRAINRRLETDSPRFN